MEYYDILLEDKLNLKIQKIDEKDYDYTYAPFGKSWANAFKFNIWKRLS